MKDTKLNKRKNGLDSAEGNASLRNKRKNKIESKIKENAVFKPNRVLQAVSIIKQLNDKYYETSKKTPLLDDVSQKHLYLQVTMKKIPPKKAQKYFKVSLPNSLVNKSTEVCFIAGDTDKRDKNADVEKDLLKYKEDFRQQGITQLSEIMTLRQLRKEYKPFEAKRKLAGAYDLFLCDKKIAGVLPTLLGKEFFKKRKLPLQINMKSKNLKQQIEKALTTTVFHVSCRGNSCTSQVAQLSMTDEEIVANVKAAIDVLVKELPGKLENIMGIYLKTEKAKAFPLYMSFDGPQNISLKVNAKRNIVKAEELSTMPNVLIKVFKDGNVLVQETNEDDEDDEPMNDAEQLDTSIDAKEEDNEENENEEIGDKEIEDAENKDDEIKEEEIEEEEIKEEIEDDEENEEEMLGATKTSLKKFKTSRAAGNEKPEKLKNVRDKKFKYPESVAESPNQSVRILTSKQKKNKKRNQSEISKSEDIQNKMVEASFVEEDNENDDEMLQETKARFKKFKSNKGDELEKDCVLEIIKSKRKRNRKSNSSETHNNSINELERTPQKNQIEVSQNPEISNKEAKLKKRKSNVKTEESPKEHPSEDRDLIQVDLSEVDTTLIKTKKLRNSQRVADTPEDEIEEVTGSNRRKSKNLKRKQTEISMSQDKLQEDAKQLKISAQREWEKISETDPTDENKTRKSIGEWHKRNSLSLKKRMSSKW